MDPVDGSTPLRSSPRASRGRDFLVGVVAGTGALLLLGVASARQDEWLVLSTENFDFEVGGWVIWLGGFVAAGFLAGLAIRPPRSLRYRPGRAAVVSLVPLLMIVHGIAIFGAEMRPPGFLDQIRFYMGPDVQAILAVVIGFAFALGFDAGGAEPARSDARVPPNAERQPVAATTARP